MASGVRPPIQIGGGEPSERERGSGGFAPIQIGSRGGGGVATWGKWGTIVARVLEMGDMGSGMWAGRLRPGGQLGHGPARGGL